MREVLNRDRIPEEKEEVLRRAVADLGYLFEVALPGKSLPAH